MEYLTVPEVAEELRLNPTTVRRFCYAGRLGVKIGRQWLITREELDLFKATPRPPGRPRKTDDDEPDDEPTAPHAE